MSRSRVYLYSLVLLLAVAAAVAYALWSPSKAKPAYRFAKIERGPLTAAVSATGTLNPVVSVQVGSQVSGQVKEIYADFNSQVKKDQVIALIDPDTFKLRVNQAEADLEAARATVLTQRANVVALQAEVSRAKVNLADTRREFERNQLLFDKGFVSAAQRDKAQAAFEAAQEQVKTAEAQRGVGEAQVRNVEALVKQRESQLAQARVDLERTAIRAPVDGIVISRNVDAGQTVAASLQAPTLFVIARNLAEMQVDTSIDEAEVGRLRVGQDATFTVDSFAGRNFSGKVTQVRKAPQVIQNVVSYIAVISAPNPELNLVPGMTANVRIVVDSRDSVLKVPSAALRFRPLGAADATGPAGAAAKAQGGGGGAQAAQALRERLTKELSLTAEQQARLEAIQQETRSSIAALSRDNEDERRRQIQKLRAESRVRIAAMLNDEQRVRYEEMQAEGRAATRGRVWVMDEAGKPKAVNVRLGLSDGSFSELVGANLKEGTQVIVGTAGPAGSRPAQKAGGPGLF